MRTFVVILGAAVRSDGSPSGTLVRRIQSALRFGKSRGEICYLVSGAGKGNKAEWLVMKQLLLDSGVAAESILSEREGTDTLRQIRNCVAILRAADATSTAWVSTSRYHQARSWLLFRTFGMAVRLVPPLADRPHVSMSKWLLFWIREIVALPYDGFVAMLMSRGLYEA